jgi:hypothetical protein
MADQEGQQPGAPSSEVIEQLRRAGFFDQMGGLEQNLKVLADSLKSLGDATVQRVQEMDSLIAHVLAIEAILGTILKTHPVDGAAVRALVRQRTGDISKDGQGSPAVLSVVDDLLGKQE